MSAEEIAGDHTMTLTWNGMPQNSEKDGWHWLQSQQHYNAGNLTIGRWENGRWQSPQCSPQRLAETDNYLGPVLTPKAHDAPAAERDELKLRADVLEHGELVQKGDDAGFIKVYSASLAMARREGAEAMREMAAQACAGLNTYEYRDETVADAVVMAACRTIRAIPLPGDEA